MQLLSKQISLEKIIPDLKDYIFENEIDSLLGVQQTTKGIFILLFSHRYNRQSPVIITGTHDLEKISKQAYALLGRK